MCTISSLRKIQVNVPAVQSQSPAVRSESGDMLSVTERATGAPFLIHVGSIGNGFRSVRVVSNVAHCKVVVIIAVVTGYTSVRPSRQSDLLAQPRLQPNQEAPSHPDFRAVP